MDVVNKLDYKLQKYDIPKSKHSYLAPLDLPEASIFKNVTAR
jgi:hypothetical protein